MKDKLQNGVKEVVQRTSVTKKFGTAAGPVSAEKDELDDIYKEEDPIEASIAIRKKAGNL
jgi:hypothetical protein